MGSIPHYFFFRFLFYFYWLVFLPFWFYFNWIRSLCTCLFISLSLAAPLPIGELQLNRSRTTTAANYLLLFSIDSLHCISRCCKCNMYRFIVVRCVYVHTNQFKLNALTYSQVKMYRCFTKHTHYESVLLLAFVRRFVQSLDLLWIWFSFYHFVCHCPSVNCEWWTCRANWVCARAHTVQTNKQMPVAPLNC